MTDVSGVLLCARELIYLELGGVVDVTTERHSIVVVAVGHGVRVAVLVVIAPVDQFTVVVHARLRSGEMVEEKETLRKTRSVGVKSTQRWIRAEDENLAWLFGRRRKDFVTTNLSAALLPYCA